MSWEPLLLGRAGTDRAGHLRTEPDLVDRLWESPATRVLRVGDGRVPVVESDDGVRLDLVSPEEIKRPDLARGAVKVFLGLGPDGAGYLAVDAEPRDGWLGLRQLGPVLDDLDVGLLTEAVAVLAWHGTHTHCPRCGHPTEPVDAGWVRRCPEDGSGHYPRTDPAVIMSVVDADDRVMLGHNAAWPEGRFSTLAGFVEPGESLEAAVRREVGEEVGLPVDEVVYLGSQPWPFPSSLMVGFTARTTQAELRVDGVEISEARWFTRDELAADVAAGRVRLPGPISIARRILEHWYGGPIADALS